MEYVPQPHHREGFEKLMGQDANTREDAIRVVNDAFDALDVAHEEGIEDNYAFDIDKAKSPDEKKAAFIEKIKPKFSAFLTKQYEQATFRPEDTDEEAKTKEKAAVSVKQRPVLRSLGYVEWKKLAGTKSESRFGMYTLNPETQRLDFESIPQGKIKVLPMAEMKGENLAEIAEFVVATYGATHHIPCIEYAQYLDQNPDRVPESVRGEGEKRYFLGSIVVNPDGEACAPKMWVGDVWDDSKSHMSTRPITVMASLEINSFRDGDGIVLIEK